MMDRQKNCPELLITIPQIGIKIFKDYIWCQYSPYKMQQEKENLTQTSATITNSSFGEDQKFIFHLSMSQTAFKVNEDNLTITFIDIHTNKDSWNFSVGDHVLLNKIKEILKNKISQCGFLKQFKVIKKIGQGGFSHVYMISSNLDSRLFAAKVLQISQIGKQQKRQRAFFNQIRILRLLDHPNIVHQYGVYYHQFKIYLILQCIRGGTLLTQLKNNCIKVQNQKWKIIYQLTSAVQYLRQNNIIHRDIKLENVMVRLNEDGSKDYILNDFGLSCQAGQESPIYVRCGTFGYLAPQILQTPKPQILFQLNHKLDIFSLGIIYHIVFMGKSVFFCKDLEELRKTNKKINVDLGSEIYDNLSYLQFKLLEGTLSNKPQKRLTTRQLLDNYILNHSSVEKWIKKSQSQNSSKSSIIQSTTKANLTKQSFNKRILQRKLSFIKQPEPIKKQGFFRSISSFFKSKQ